MIRDILFAIIFMLVVAFGAKGSDFPYQSSTYSISCDCSFIHETAAHATVQYSCYGNTFNATLEGCSVPIFGTMYCVNDTLQARFNPSGQTIQPATENVLYISGYYRKPHGRDMMDMASPSTYRNIWGGGSLSADPSTMECVNLTADMLSMFYYAKTVDFSRMPLGVPQDIDVVMPDSSNRTLQLIYNGTCDYMGRQAYRLTANFTYEGALSAYPISVIIDPELGVPVEFTADIAIGRVVMSYDY